MTEYKDDIFIEPDWGDGSGIEEMKSFFESFCCEFAKFSMNYHNKLGEFPFVYKERALTSVVLPSLMKADPDGAFVFMEQPFKKIDGTQRFLDFYVDHGKNLYLIEMKHQWEAERTENLTNNVVKVWKNSLKQIADLNKKIIYEHISSLEGYDNVFKIALLVLPTFISQKNELDFQSLSFKSKEVFHNKIKKSFLENEKMKKEKLAQPNFFGIWKIKENMDLQHEYDGGYEFFPYVSFVAYQKRVK